MAGFILCVFFGSMVYYLKKINDLMCDVKNEIFAITDSVCSGSMNSNNNDF